MQLSFFFFLFKQLGHNFWKLSLKLKTSLNAQRCSKPLTLNVPELAAKKHQTHVVWHHHSKIHQEQLPTQFASRNQWFFFLGSLWLQMHQLVMKTMNVSQPRIDLVVGSETVVHNWFYPHPFSRTLGALG